MANWVERANQAYKDRLARIEAQNKDQTNRLIKLTSDFLDTEVVPIDTSIPGRITIEEDGKWMIFAFADPEETKLAIIFECTMCGGDYPVNLNSMEDLGIFLNEGLPAHKKVCRNQQKD